MVRTARVAGARRLRVEPGGCRAHESRARDRDGVRDRLPGRPERSPTPAAARTSARSVVGPVALFLVVLPARRAADPRAARRLPGRIQPAGGYGALGDAGQSEVGDPLGSDGVWAAWPLGFASAPGAYAGAVALACVLVAARARRLRSLVIAVGGLALVAYVLTSSLAGRSPVVPLAHARDPLRGRLSPQPGPPPVRGRPGAADPGRRRTAGAGGTTALASRRRSSGSGPPSPCSSSGRSAPVGAPFGSGCSPRSLLVAAPVLFGFATRRWRWASATALIGLLSIELVASAVYAQTYEGGTVFTGLETGEHPALVPQVLRFPSLSEDDYLVATPIVEHIRRHPGRYATWAPPAAFYEKGYLWMKSPLDWPALAPSARLAVRDPRRPRLQPRAAPSLLALHPQHERAVGLLQRLGPQRAVSRGRPRARVAVPGRPHRNRASRRGSRGRGSRRLLAVGAGRYATAVDRHLDGGGRGRPAFGDGRGHEERLRSSRRKR